MADYKEQLNTIETKIQNIKIEKAKTEERLKSLKEEETAILEELKGSGIEDVSKLPMYIDERKIELEKLLADIEKRLEN